MSLKIYRETIIKWLKRTGAIGGTLIISYFAYLSIIGAITITGYSGDTVCAGTFEDPCYAYINFTANEDIFIYPNNYDPWGRNTTFEFNPSVRSWKLQRSWGNGWRDIPLNESCTGTWCGLSNAKDTRQFSVAFRAGKSYQIRIVAYKNSPFENVKWGAFDGRIDPIWYADFSKLTPDNVFTELISSYADLTYGEARFKIHVPDSKTDTKIGEKIDYQDLLNFTFEKGNFQPEKVEYFIVENKTTEKPIYEINKIRKSCKITEEYLKSLPKEAFDEYEQIDPSFESGLTKKEKDKNFNNLYRKKYVIGGEYDCSEYEQIEKGTETITTEIMIPSEGYKFKPNNEYVIYMKAEWGAELGHRYVDWKPEITLKKEYTGYSKDIKLKQDKWTWWDSSWSYRKGINVTTPINLTDYQVYLYVNTSQLIGDNKLQSDCDDIRFTDAYDNAVSYFIDDDIGCSNTASVLSRIWVKGNFTTNNGTQLYMYYGNSVTSTSLSNGWDTLYLYDNFTTTDGYTDNEVQPNSFEYDGVFTGYPWVNTTAGYLYCYSTGTSPYHSTMRYINGTHPSDNFAARTKMKMRDNYDTGTSTSINFYIHTRPSAIYYDDYYLGLSVSLESYPPYTDRMRIYNVTAGDDTHITYTKTNSTTGPVQQGINQHNMYEWHENNGNYKAYYWENWEFSGGWGLTVKNPTNINETPQWLGFSNRYREAEIHYLKVWNERNDVSYVFNTEEIQPNISVTLSSPINTTYATTSVTISGVSSKAANITYSIDGGTNQTSCVNCTSFSNSSGVLAEGQHNVTVYAKQYNGNEKDSKTVVFTMDFTAPTITFTAGTLDNETSTTSNRQTIGITLSETGNVCILTWNGTNETMDGSGTNFYKVKRFLEDEANYTFQVWCNDSVGNLGVSETRWLSVNHLFRVENTTIAVPLDEGTGNSNSITFAICDLNNDEIDDYVFTQYATSPRLLAYYGNGTQYWNFSDDVYRFSDVLCGDIDGNGYNEVILGYKYDGYTANRIYMFEHNGTIRKYTTVSGNGLIHGLSLANMSGMPTNTLQVVGFDCGGTIHFYDSELKEWNTKPTGKSSTDGRPITAKMWNNVNDTCVCEYYGKCFCYEYPYSSEYWNFQKTTLGGASNNEPLKIDDESYYLATTHINAESDVRNTTSKTVLWENNDLVSSYYGNGFFVTEDMTGDGREEIYIANPQNSYVGVLDENGTVLWEYNDTTRAVGSMGWGDFNGDGKKEGITLTTLEGEVRFLHKIYYELDTTAPQYANSTASQNTTNGGWTLLSLLWSDNNDLDDYMFSIKNESGTEATYNVWNGSEQSQTAIYDIYCYTPYREFAYFDLSDLNGNSSANIVEARLYAYRDGVSGTPPNTVYAWFVDNTSIWNEGTTCDAWNVWSGNTRANQSYRASAWTETTGWDYANITNIVKRMLDDGNLQFSIELGLTTEATGITEGTYADWRMGDAGNNRKHLQDRTEANKPYLWINYTIAGKEAPYVNQSWTDFSATTSGYSNGTFYLNDTAGTEVCWKVYANDTADNLNVSEGYCFTITSAPSLRNRLIIIY